jgi:hypothetical protein
MQEDGCNFLFAAVLLAAISRNGRQKSRLRAFHALFEAMSHNCANVVPWSDPMALT